MSAPGPSRGSGGAPSSASTEPTRIDRYEIERVLGRGAMGKVYLARDTVIGRRAALKTFLVSAGSDEDVHALRKQLVREARAAGAVSHPNVVTIYDVLEGEGDGDEAAFFLAMEYVEGQSLEARLKEEAPLDPLPIVRQVAAALDHLHQKGIIHRDIKPANVLIAADGTVKLTDFGIARPSDPNATQDTMLFGTPMYMAPEVLRGRTADTRSEVFALGVLVYEMLTRAKPFTAKTVAAVTQQILHEPHRPPTDLVPAMPAEIVEVIDRALAKDPKRRFESAGALANALAAAMRAGAPPDSQTLSFAPPTGATRRLPGWRRVSWLRVTAAVLAVVVAGLGWALWSAWADREAEPVIDTQAATREASYLMLVSEGRRLIDEGDPTGAAALFATAERMGVRNAEAIALRERALAVAAELEAEEAQRAAAAQAAAADRPRRRAAEQDRGGSTAAVVASAEQILSGAPAEPAPAVIEGTPARLLLRLASEAPRGVLIVYVAGQQVVNEPFAFYERRGLFGRKGVPGSLERSVEVPPGEQQVRVFLTRPGEAAQLVELVRGFAAGEALAWQIDLPAEGPPTAALVASETADGSKAQENG